MLYVFLPNKKSRFPSVNEELELTDRKLKRKKIRVLVTRGAQLDDGFLRLPNAPRGVHTCSARIEIAWMDTLDGL